MRDIGQPFHGLKTAGKIIDVVYHGSLCGISQYRFINKASQAGVAWNDPTKDTAKIRDFHQNELGLALQWRVPR